MSAERRQTGVPTDGDPGLRPERQASPAALGRRPWRRKGRGGGKGENLMVPRAEFRSYYGLPVLNAPTWQDHDIAGYLFLGGLAGASSALGAAADLTGRPHLARALKVGATGALGGSLYALIHDLGRPERFLNMLRVAKVTSPMSMGTWLLGAYAPAVGTAAATALTGGLPRTGRAATVGAGVLGAGVATYTAALISNTAVPVWHDAHREMPFLFAGSAASAAGGLGMLAAPLDEAGPARRAGLVGAMAEIAAGRVMERRMGEVAEPLSSGLGGRLVRLGEILSALGGLLGITLGRRRRRAAAAAGASLLAGSLLTRFGIFHAGMASADDPRYTVGPQRDRLQASRNGDDPSRDGAS
jgi:formate-dependent nitrite reductase membrane component NrfD